MQPSFSKYKITQNMSHRSNAIKLIPEKTSSSKIVGEVGIVRKQTQKVAPRFLGLPTFQRFSQPAPPARPLENAKKGLAESSNIM